MFNITSTKLAVLPLDTNKKLIFYSLLQMCVLPKNNSSILLFNKNPKIGISKKNLTKIKKKLNRLKKIKF